MKARDPQPTVRVPREALPEQQQENEGHSRKHQVEKRFALEEQAPVHRLLPTRVEEIENLLQMAPSDRQPRQPDMRHALVVAVDRKSTRLNSSHVEISYAVFCLKKKKNKTYT